MEKRLKKLLENAYAPYSHLKVSCIVKDKDCNEYEGVNVEISSFGGTICAERNALNHSLAKGIKKENIASIHIMNNTNEWIMPCMICRQHFIDFLNDDTKIYVYNQKGEKKEFTKQELCPYPFRKEDFQ